MSRPEQPKFSEQEKGPGDQEKDAKPRFPNEDNLSEAEKEELARTVARAVKDRKKEGE